MATELPPGPGDALLRLDAALEARRPGLEHYMAYFDGHHPLAFATAKFRQTFGNLFKEFADNWCPLVVHAAAERMTVQGFRFGTEDKADDDAWGLWRENYLDEDSGIAHVDLCKLGEAYAIVAPDAERGARITVEHGLQVITEEAAGDRRTRAYALKKWLDETGHLYATLYTPLAVWKYQSEKTVDEITDEVQWVEREGVEFMAPHRLGVVPVIPLRNNPDLLNGGTSDLDAVIDVQNGVNKLVADMLIASEYAAFRQRWATGIELPTGEDGQPLDEERFLSFIGRVWAVEDVDAKFGEFGVTDLGNYVKAVEMLIQHLAARTRTPPHYLLGQSGAFPSGESLKSTETGLVAKVKDKHKHVGGGWAETMHLALKAADKGDKGRGTTLWTDPESRTLGEVVDAALKMADLGVPRVALWERIGATPEQIIRWEKLYQEEQAALMAATLAGALPNGQGLPGGAPGAPSTPGTTVPPARVSVRLGTGGGGGAAEAGGGAPG